MTVLLLARSRMTFVSIARWGQWSAVTCSYERRRLARGSSFQLTRASGFRRNGAIDGGAEEIEVAKEVRNADVPLPTTLARTYTIYNRH